MGQFRPVDRLELVERDGRTTLVTFRPRRRRRLDSAAYPGLLPPVVHFRRIVRLIAERQMTLWEL